METMKKTLAAVVALALLSLTPGPGCYAALAQVNGSASAAARIAPVVGLPAVPTLPAQVTSIGVPTLALPAGVAGLAAGSARAAQPNAPVAARAVRTTASPVDAKKALVQGVQQVGQASNDGQRKGVLDRIFTAGKVQAEDDSVAGRVSASAPSLARPVSLSSVKARAPPAARRAGLALAAGLGL